MATTTNYGWTTPDDTALVKDGAAAIRTLGSSVDTTTKALNPGTTNGDLDYYSTGTTKTRLAIGTTGQVLTVAGGVPSWATGGGGMTLISETVASAATGISFSSISSSYKQLMLVWSGVEASATGSNFTIRMNNNSGSVYFENSFYFSPSVSSLISGSGTSIGGTAGFSSFGENFNVAGNLAQASKGFLLIDNYASSTKFKTFSTQLGYRNVSGAYNFLYSSTGIFNSTTAITSLDIVRTTGTATISNQTNSTIRLYGVS
jgi:hypothetical protein